MKIFLILGHPQWVCLLLNYNSELSGGVLLTGKFILIFHGRNFTNKIGEYCIFFYQITKFIGLNHLSDLHLPPLNLLCSYTSLWFRTLSMYFHHWLGSVLEYHCKFYQWRFWTFQDDLWYQYPKKLVDLSMLRIVAIVVWLHSLVNRCVFLSYISSTLLVLIDFFPVESEFLTWSFAY